MREARSTTCTSTLAAPAGPLSPPVAATPDALPRFASNWAFFLDIDGTLLEFADHPGKVVVEPSLLSLLNGLRDAAGGALALVSGRSIDDVTSLLGPLGFAIAGQHGAEMGTLRAAGDGVSRPRSTEIRAVVDELRVVAARHPGMLVEDKGLSVAIHYRLDPSLARSARHAARVAQRRLGDGYEVLEGKHVAEIKPGGRDKGSAIVELLGEPPFTGRVPVFIGDDSTDELGFTVVNRQGGHSIKVGPGGTQARWRLADAVAVRRWLADYVRWREGDPPTA